MLNTVKPLYSGHPSDFSKVSTMEKLRLFQKPSFFEEQINYGSNLETRTCGVEAIRRPQKDEASSLLPIFQTKLAILRQRDIVFFFLHQPQVASWNVHSYFLPDENEWGNRSQQIQRPIIAEQRLSQFFSNFTDYCPLYRSSISAKIVPSNFEMSTMRGFTVIGIWPSDWWTWEDIKIFF